MMTEQEIIDVVKAHQEGKTILYKLKYKGKCTDEYGWLPAVTPTWDFAHLDYRVKPEEKVRPYNGQKEFVKDMISHRGILKSKGCEDYYIISLIANRSVWINASANLDNTLNQMSVSYENLLDQYTWTDGSPCGILKG